MTHDVPDVEEVIGAPVLDGMVTGFKMAEMMADLRAAGIPTVSRHGWFQRPPAKDFDTLRRFQGRFTTEITEITEFTEEEIKDKDFRF